MAKQKRIHKSTIIKLQAGQEKAFDKIYEAYKDRFYFMAYNFLKNEDDAKDAVQDIFIKILQDIKDLKHPEAFHVWSYRLAYHICLQTASQKRTHEDDYNSSMEEYEDEQMNITHEVIHKEVSEYILDIIQAMPTSLRSVCLLRFYEQLSVKEIDEILDVSENAVKLRIRRAKNYIKDELELKGITPGVISSALDPNALLLLFVTCQNLHTLSLTTSKSIAAAITNEVSFTAGATVSTTSLTIATLVTTLAITGGAIIYNLSDEEPKTPPLQEMQEEPSKIVDFHYPQEYTNQPISLEVKTTNQNYDYITINNKNTTTIHSNGIYTVSLIKNNQVIDSKELTIHTIDTSSPDKKSITKDGDIYTIVFKDNLSMINKNSIEIFANEQKIYNYTFNEETQTLELPMDSQYLYRINVADKAGNYTYLTTTSD